MNGGSRIPLQCPRKAIIARKKRTPAWPSSGSNWSTERQPGKTTGCRHAGFNRAIFAATRSYAGSAPSASMAGSSARPISTPFSSIELNEIPWQNDWSDPHTSGLAFQSNAPLNERNGRGVVRGRTRWLKQSCDTWKSLRLGQHAHFDGLRPQELYENDNSQTIRCSRSPSATLLRRRVHNKSPGFGIYLANDIVTIDVYQ
jgi:hypothetical protein